MCNYVCWKILLFFGSIVGMFLHEAPFLGYIPEDFLQCGLYSFHCTALETFINIKNLLTCFISETCSRERTELAMWNITGLQLCSMPWERLHIRVWSSWPWNKMNPIHKQMTRCHCSTSVTGPVSRVSLVCELFSSRLHNFRRVNKLFPADIIQVSAINKTLHLSARTNLIQGGERV